MTGGIASDEPLTGADPELGRRLLRYTRPYRLAISASLVLLLIDAVLALAGPALTRRTLDVALPAHDTGMLTRLGMIYAGALLLSAIGEYLQTVLTTWVGQRIMSDLRRQLFAHVQQLSVPFFDRQPVGRLVTRLTSDVETLNELFSSGLVTVIGDLATLVAVSVMMLLTNWRLALVAFTVLPAMAAVVGFFRTSMRQAFRDIRAAVARLNAYLQEQLSGVRVVQLFNRQRATAENFAVVNREVLDANMRSIMLYALFFPVVEFLTAASIAMILWYTGFRGAGFGLSMGVVAAFIQLVRRFFQPLQDLSEKFNLLQAAMASGERIFRLLDTESPLILSAAKDLQTRPGTLPGGPSPSARDEGLALPLTLSAAKDLQTRHGMLPGGPSPSARDEGLALPLILSAAKDLQTRHGTLPGGPSPSARDEGLALPLILSAAKDLQTLPTPVRGEIVFDDVWFRYSEDAPWALRGVSFHVRAGETVALVGHTGAGKTTVLSLLLRFYVPTRGRITVDGVDLANVSTDSLRRAIGFVPQDLFLFRDTLARNLRLDRDVPDSVLDDALAAVGADALVRRLPGGLTHAVAERGRSLSVGERQLLSFARALVGDPPILLLDEATSAVDPETEGRIQAALTRLRTGRTALIVAHRLGTILDADRIMVFHHGELRESGSHRELMAQGGLYQRLVLLQRGDPRSLRSA